MFLVKDGDFEVVKTMRNVKEDIREMGLEEVANKIDVK